MIVFVLILFAVLFVCLALVVDAEQKSDEERKDLGLGPKGQGR